MAGSRKDREELLKESFRRDFGNYTKQMLHRMEWSEKTRGPTLTVPSEPAETRPIEKQMKDYFSFDSSDSSEVEKDVFGPGDKKSKDEKSLAELESEVFGGKSHPAPRSKMEKSDLAAREDEVFDRY